MSKGATGHWSSVGLRHAVHTALDRAEQVALALGCGGWSVVIHVDNRCR